MDSDHSKRKKKERRSKKKKFPETDEEKEDSILDEEEEEEDSLPKEEEALEWIFEKRPSVRLQGWREILNKLRFEYSEEFADSTIETITSAISTPLKKGNTVEICTVLRLCCLYSLTLGEEAVSLWASLKPTLMKMSSTHSDPEVRRAAVFTLSFVLFLSSEERDEIEEGLTFLTSLIKEDKNNREMIIRGWGLLATLLPPSLVSSKYFKEHLKVLAGLITPSNPSAVKLMAAENVALLFDMERVVTTKTFDPYNYVTILSIDHLLENLHGISDVGKKKEDRKALRKHLRAIIASIQDGDDPDESVRTGNQTVELTSWEKIKQFSFVKDTLKDGLHKHLLENDLLHNIFEYERPITKKEKLSGSERKALKLSQAEDRKMLKQSRDHLRKKKGR